MQNRKLELVKVLLPLLPEEWQQPEHQALISWWYNIRDSGGLRLTEHGYNIMHNVLEIESWSVALDDSKKLFPKKLLLAMDRKLQWPYYINYSVKKVIFFSSREALMANLYGDLSGWLVGQIEPKQT